MRTVSLHSLSVFSKVWSISTSGSAAKRYQRLALLMDQALAEQARSGAVDLHRAWIEALLGEYYDPMYAYQRESKAERIEFAGDQPSVVEYLRNRKARSAP